MLDDSHPLTLELDSLRSAVARFQDEAYNASVKLQRFSFDTSSSQDRISQLEIQNELLQIELKLLQDNPHPELAPEPQSTVRRTQELTLALRKVSEKLSLTEETLKTRTTELTHATSEIHKSRATVEGAYALAAQIRGREEEGKVRERQLERQVLEAKEEAKMADLVVKEYADLVRSLEGRKSRPDVGSSPSATPLANSLSEGKAGLQQLFNDFSGELEKLKVEVMRLEGELAESKSQTEGERKGAEADRLLLAQVQHELETLKLDDKTAAKMVSRYMKFSQTSTNTLQVSLKTLETRHSATIDTLSAQIADLTHRLQTSETTSEKLRATLDELGKDIMRESFGRRREIALRLRLVAREEMLNEGLEKLVRRVHETSERHPSDHLRKILEESQSLLTSVNGPEDAENVGSLARIVAAESTARGLMEELRAEKEQRLLLETRPLYGQDGERVVYANGHIEVPETREKNLPLTPRTPASPSSPPRLATEYARLKTDFPPGLEHAPASPPDDVLETETAEIQPAPSVVIPPVEPTSPEVPSSIESPKVELEELLESEESSSSSANLTKLSPPLINVLPTPDDTVQFPSDSIAGVSSQPEDPPQTRPFPGSSIRRPPTNSPSPPPVQELTSDPKPPPLPIAPSPQRPGLVAFPVTAESSLDQDPSPISASHPLLTELEVVSRRYDELQRAFRDCHLALQDLRKQPLDSSPIPEQIFRTAVDRLDDYTEDARVELEIRIADEELKMQGYETMLRIPGSFSLSDQTHGRTYSQESQFGASTPTFSELEVEIRRFVSGEDPTVQKARQGLEAKLADVQHDIAKLKLALHPLAPEDLSVDAEPPETQGSSSNHNAGWVNWLAGSSSRPASPNPTPAPTFGNVMTTPRLRHASSITRLRQQQQTSKEESNPFSTLGLKVAMPNISLGTARSSRAPSFSSNGPASPIQRSRTISMLGIGGGRNTPRVFSASPMMQSRSTSGNSVSVVESGLDGEVE